MALILTGQTPAVVFDQTGSVSTSGKTQCAHLLRIRLPSARTNSEQIFSSAGANVNNLGRVSVSTSTLFSAIRTTGTNGQNTTQGLGTWTPGGTYTVASVCDLSAGFLRHYLDGVQVGSDVNVSGGTFLTTTFAAELLGSPTTGNIHHILECAIWLDALPSAADLAAYTAGTKTLDQFASPPNRGWWKPIGDGTTPIATLTDLSVAGVNMTQTAGATSGALAPVADGGTGATGLLWLRTGSGQALILRVG